MLNHHPESIPVRLIWWTAVLLALLLLFATPRAAGGQQDGVGEQPPSTSDLLATKLS